MKKLIIIISFLTIGCTKIYLPDQPSPVTNTPITDPIPKIIHDSITFHVIGNALAAKIKYSDSANGLNQVTTTLPFQITLDSTKDNTFVSLEATSTGFGALVANPFLEVQILINGVLFREASTASFFLDTISVSGTYKR